MNKIFRFLLLLIFNFFIISNSSISNEKKIRIGLLVPLTGDNAELGKQIVKATKLALGDIDAEQIEIYPKDTRSDPNKTLRSAIELQKDGINLVIGPIFHKNLIFLNEISDVTFLYGPSTYFFPMDVLPMYFIELQFGQLKFLIRCIYYYEIFFITFMNKE